MWLSGNFEQMAACIFILEKFQKTFDRKTWELLDNWIDQIDNWALCDWMAPPSFQDG